MPSWTNEVNITLVYQMRSVYVYRIKEEKTIFKPLAGVEPHLTLP